MAATVKKAAAKSAEPKERFLIALRRSTKQRIERLTFVKKQRLGTRWFRNDTVEEAIDFYLAALDASKEKSAAV